MLLSTELHVIRTNRNTRGIERAICCFHVIQNFVLTNFVLSKSTVVHNIMFAMPRATLYAACRQNNIMLIVNGQAMHTIFTYALKANCIVPYKSL